MFITIQRLHFIIYYYL